ncbi:MAG: cell wall hydrolase [Ruminococcus sp.]|nr:cell wall hydrolase [Ruminococcus sp.]
MREAKFAASVFGVVTACLIGGGVVAYNAAPQVNTSDNFEIVKPAGDDLTLAAAETSVKTTTAKTSAKRSFTRETLGITSSNKQLTFNVRENTGKSTYVVTTTAVVTEPVTTVVTTVTPPTEPVTEAPTEPETEEEVEEFYYEEPMYMEEYEEEEEYVEPETEAPAEETVTEPETAAPTEPVQEVSSETTDNALPISDSDFILLCNVVGHEAGSYWISEFEKACVVEVVMNRVKSPLYANSIYGVLTQPGQFSGCYSYVNLGKFSGYVTESVKNAVKLYFNDPSKFTQGYLSFYGDGRRNYFK